MTFAIETVLLRERDRASAARTAGSRAARAGEVFGLLRFGRIGGLLDGFAGASGVAPRATAALSFALVPAPAPRRSGDGLRG